MTESLSLPAASAADRRQSLSVSPAPPLNHLHAHAAPAFVDGIVEDDDGEIACICAYSDDDGNTIQCDKCLRWQHILCYYPPPKEVPGEDQKHYCVDCVHQDDLDARKATERQRKALEQRNGLNGVKRPAPKSHKKKPKDSPSLGAQVNGWPSDRHTHLHNHDRKSASPREGPPAAKRPKTSHRPSNSTSHAHARKRAGTATIPQRSPSKSPEVNGAPILPQYSDEFLQMSQPHSPQVDTDTNLMSNISVTNTLANWLTDSELVETATNGLAPSAIFKRWDGTIEDIPGRPEVTVQWVEDRRFAQNGLTPRWAQLSVNSDVAPGTFIGELRGHLGFKDDYLHDADNRWNELRHPEPFVFFHPQLPIVIDARQEGSLFRYVRRSCQPNADIQTIITEGTEYHFCFMANREIMPGEEVTVAWQVPESVRDRISSSISQSNSFQPNVREYIQTWVSKVLANCGPCACNGEGNCLMAHYDRRGHPLPPEPTLKRTKKKRLPHLETAVTSRSRSASEARKLEDDDETDSRSVSGSRGSVSRDMTPSTHYSVNTAAGPQELSEREKKKLMREEEMFRRQEAETGRQKKKRNSGGSNFNTPSTATSKQLGFPPNARYADATTSSSRLNLGSRQPSGKRKAGQALKTPRKESAAVAKTPSASYVDVSVQCDMDAEIKPPVERTRRKYVSATQRLLQRCISNNSKHKAAERKPSATADPPEEAMDVDTDTHLPSPTSLHKVEAETHGDLVSVLHEAKQEVATLPLPKSPPSLLQQDTVMTEAESEYEPPPPLVEEPVVDTIPQGAPAVQSEPNVQLEPEPDAKAEPEATKAESPVATQKSPTQETSSPAVSHSSALPSHIPMEPPPPPWVSSPQKDGDSSPAPSVSSQQSHAEHQRHKPNMHVEMPQPPANPFATRPPPLTAQTSGLAVVSSPSALSPGGSGPPHFNMPVFSPSVTAAVTPSPVRKKLSLSDYTKRSKARESGGEASLSFVPNPSTLSAESSVATDAAKDNDPAVSTGEPSFADQIAEVIHKARQSARAEDGKTDSAVKAENENAIADDTPAPLVREVSDAASVGDLSATAEQEKAA